MRNNDRKVKKELFMPNSRSECLILKEKNEIYETGG